MVLSGELSEHEARRLLALGFPDLALDRVHRFAAGWDNTAFLVDNRWIFRFPRHPLAAELLRREIELLAFVAPRLPSPVPGYAYVSGPLLDFPFTFAGYRMLPGRPLFEVADLGNALLTEPLARFLAALHGIPDRQVPATIPRFTPETWLKRHDRLVESALPAVSAHDPALADAVRAWWVDYRADPRAVAFAPCLIHGDLSVEHILLDERGRLSGVIDFGDAMVADPALDLAGLSDDLFQAVVPWFEPQHGGTSVRRSAYRRLAPLHAVAAASSLSRPELLAVGLAELRQRFDRDKRGHESRVE